MDTSSRVRSTRRGVWTIQDPKTPTVRELDLAGFTSDEACLAHGRQVAEHHAAGFLLQRQGQDPGFVPARIIEADGLDTPEGFYRWYPTLAVIKLPPQVEVHDYRTARARMLRARKQAIADTPWHHPRAQELARRLGWPAPGAKH